MKLLRRWLLLGLCAGLLFAPSLAYAASAQGVDPLGQSCQAADPTAQSAVCQDNKQQNINHPNPVYGPGGILTTVINILSLIAGVIAVFVVMIAGVKLITSSGNPDTVSSARQTIIYAVISLVLVGSAQLVVHFILSKI